MGLILLSQNHIISFMYLHSIVVCAVACFFISRHIFCDAFLLFLFKYMVYL